MRLFTMGFTKISAETFFGRLKSVGVKRVIDVRLNNISQLAGFAKKEDLRFFLKSLGGIDYLHETELAPTAQLLDEYKKGKGRWEEYEKKFLDLIRRRQIEKEFPQHLFHDACLLCSEDKPHFCHRRLIAEYLRDQWGDVEIRHL